MSFSELLQIVFSAVLRNLFFCRNLNIALAFCFTKLNNISDIVNNTSSVDSTILIEKWLVSENSI